MKTALLLILSIVSVWSAVPPPLPNTATVQALNVQDMVTNPLPEGGVNIVYLLGYWYPGDDGGGVFYRTNIITGTNYVMRMGTRRSPHYNWQRLPLAGNLFTQKMSGARVDGTTDDASRTQDALNTVTNSGRLFFSGGTTKMQSTLTLPKRFTIESPTPENGSDINPRRNTILLSHSDDGIKVSTNVTGTSSATVLRNLHVKRDTSNPSTNSMIKMNNVTGGLVEDSSEQVLQRRHELSGDR